MRIDWLYASGRPAEAPPVHVASARCWASSSDQRWLWFGAPEYHVSFIPGEHWVVRGHGDAEAHVLHRRGFGAVLDWVELPVAGVGVVRCTMRPNAPCEAAAIVTGVERGGQHQPARLNTYLYSLAGMPPTPAEVVWSALRRAAGGKS